MYSVIKYIDNHIKEKLTLDYVADFAGYSKWHFCSLFKRFTGKSFVDYINDKKMQYAVNDIIRGEKVTNVAFEYGFDTISGFNKAFLKKFGCYPTQYKKLGDEFHRKYKERKESMFKLSDRCQILKDKALKNELELKVGFRTRYYMAKGEANAPSGSDNLEIYTSGLVSLIENMPCYIQDGELIVGSNFGYESRYNINLVPNAKERLESEGFTPEEMEDFFSACKKIEYQMPKKVEYTESEKVLEKEWTAIGRPMVSDHNVLDYASVLELGFSGLYKKVEGFEGQTAVRHYIQLASVYAKVLKI